MNNKFNLFSKIKTLLILFKKRKYKMLISHRGNINGRFESYENEPNYIDKAISNGFDVEIDMWWIDGKTFLGHDIPQYEVDDKWLEERMDKLWIHCKNE